MRFAALCVLALLILCGVYALRSDSKQGHAVSVDHLYAVGDPVFGRDLWIIIELPSDDRGRRTRLGRQMAGHVCSAIKAGQEVGWTPIVVGGRSTCCRSSRCRHLHPSDLPKMNHSLPMHQWHNLGDLKSAMRSAAFLAAIKRGANFIFQANAEVYYLSGVNETTYKSELKRQLRKMTIGISVGLVKQALVDDKEKYFFDPYAHFRPDFVVPLGEEDIVNKYRICEIRPPSIEKFLDTDGFSMDSSAPAVTLPANEISSPFDSRNAMFGTDVFWSLVPLPMPRHYEAEYYDDLPVDEAELANEVSREEYVIRSVVAQAVMAEVAGSSTKFNVAQTPTSGHVAELSRLSVPMTHLVNFTRTWRCPRASRTALTCLRMLVDDLVDREMLGREALTVTDLWVRDMEDVGYTDVPTGSRSQMGFLSGGSSGSPCIGDDGLQGVYFSPALQRNWEQQRSRESKFIDSFLPASKSNSAFVNKQLSTRAIERLCPTVDLQNQKYDEAVHDGLLLIVTFNRKEYHSIPLFEVIYRHHFKNILYCGEPDPVVDDYMSQYQGLQGSHFSFLPAHSKTGYECLLGAIEMGYDVQGYMIVTQDTLVNSWNFGELDPSTVWHGNEHVLNISSENIRGLDTKGEKVMRSTHGILQALEFLEDVLLGGSDEEDDDHSHEQTEAAPSHHHQRRSLPRAERDLSMGVYDFLSTDESVDTDEQLRRQRSEQLDAQPNQESDLAVQMTKMIHQQPGEEVVDDDDEEYEDHEMMDDEKMMHDDGMKSIMDDEGEDPKLHGTEKTKRPMNLHLSLFGEVISGGLVPPRPVTTSSSDGDTIATFRGADPAAAAAAAEIVNATFHNNRNVTELLFHPANFDEGGKKDLMVHSEAEEAMPVDHYRALVDQINGIYQRIGKKLSSWRNNDSQEKTVKCDASANKEICNLVADFFLTLEWSEGDDFHLFYDDLPIYYVPSTYKDKLYLMANLFTKYQVSDELAFPMLLRGLSQENTWTDLVRAEMPEQREKQVIDKPQDLLVFDHSDEAHRVEVAALESAHYIYPVDMTNVLKNEDMKNVICRNF